MATTRLGLAPFDHGAQYITARGQAFKSYLDELVASAYARRWTPKMADGSDIKQMTPWFVGTPGMSSIIRPLAEGVRIATERRVHSLETGEKGWTLVFEDESSIGPYHAVAIATPPADAKLLAGRVDVIAEPLEKVRISPCWAVLVRLEDKLLPAQDVFSDMNEVIRWIARNNAKPSRPSRGDHVVIHASPGWSRETEDVESETIADELWSEASNVLSLPPTRPAQMSAFLWRQGLVDQPVGETFLYSSAHRLGVAGDWCFGRLAEHAFESGLRLGKAIAQSLE